MPFKKTKTPPAQPGYRGSPIYPMGLLTAQLERAKQAEAIQARYKALLVDSPTLVLPGDKHFAFSFNPSAVVSPGEGRMVYPTFHATADWGALDVADGVLVPSDFSQAMLAAPKATAGPHLEGPGWTLDLAPGWQVVSGDKAGSYTIKQR